MLEILFDHEPEGDDELVTAVVKAMNACRVWREFKKTEPEEDLELLWQNKDEDLCAESCHTEDAALSIEPKTANGWLLKAAVMLSSDDPFGHWWEIAECLTRAADLHCKDDERHRERLRREQVEALY